jgi:hypothetical protein
MVPAVGHPDLMDQPDQTEARASAGIGAFRDAQLPRVRAYVAVACSRERSDEAEMPELLALHGNRERPEDESLIARHLAPGAPRPAARRRAPLARDQPLARELGLRFLERGVRGRDDHVGGLQPALVDGPAVVAHELE